MVYLSDCKVKTVDTTCEGCRFGAATGVTQPRKLRVFKLRELAKATGFFCERNLLGKGSHSCVYKGVLSDGLVVAVKRPTLGRRTLQDAISFDNELEILSQLRHRHLVNLVGYCCEGLEKLLVVEFMENGTLFDLLHSNKETLSWPARLHMALQAAKAVQALHSTTPPIIHRDVKSANILIDGNWNAKLSDMGLALRGPLANISTAAPAGTMGYIDPEYQTPGHLSTKTDVFSFGILLLELMSGRRAIDVRFNPSSIVDWAVPLIRQGKALAVCDTAVNPPQDIKIVHMLAAIAARSVRQSRDRRPTMGQIVEGLQRIKRKLPLPIFRIKQSRNRIAPDSTPRSESPKGSSETGSEIGKSGRSEDLTICKGVLFREDGDYELHSSTGLGSSRKGGWRLADGDLDALGSRRSWRLAAVDLDSKVSRRVDLDGKGSRRSWRLGDAGIDGKDAANTSMRSSSSSTSKPESAVFNPKSSALVVIDVIRNLADSTPSPPSAAPGGFAKTNVIDRKKGTPTFGSKSLQRAFDLRSNLASPNANDRSVIWSPSPPTPPWPVSPIEGLIGITNAVHWKTTSIPSDSPPFASKATERAVDSGSDVPSCAVSTSSASPEEALSTAKNPSDSATEGSKASERSRDPSTNLAGPAVFPLSATQGGSVKAKVVDGNTRKPPETPTFGSQALMDQRTSTSALSGLFTQHIESKFKLNEKNSVPFHLSLDRNSGSDKVGLQVTLQGLFPDRNIEMLTKRNSETSREKKLAAACETLQEKGTTPRMSVDVHFYPTREVSELSRSRSSDAAAIDSSVHPRLSISGLSRSHSRDAVAAVDADSRLSSSGPSRSRSREAATAAAIGRDGDSNLSTSGPSRSCSREATAAAAVLDAKIHCSQQVSEPSRSRNIYAPIVGRDVLPIVWSIPKPAIQYYTNAESQSEKGKESGYFSNGPPKNFPY